MSVQYGGDKITFADGSTVASGWSGFKNRIINGAMGIWQRGTSFSVSTTTVTYTADRFGIYQPSGTGTITQDTDVPTGFQYSLKVVGAGTDLIQRIESKNAFDLSGQSVTVSFWMKQTVGAGSGSMAVALQYANSADNFSALTSISSQTLTPTSSWARYFLTFTNMPSGVANGMSVDIYPTSGGSSSTYFITGVQLEKGSTATSFDYRPYGTELTLAKRYYNRTTNTILTGGVALNGSSVDYCQQYVFPSTMRLAPTCISNGFVDTQNMNSNTISDISPESVSLRGSTYSGVGSPTKASGYWQAGIQFLAEL